MKRTFTQDGFSVTVEHIFDESPDLSYLTQDYKDPSISAREAARMRAADKVRLDQYNRGLWHMVGVAVKIRRQTASNWADGGLEVGRASVWGIESDSGADYFAEVERDMVSEAFAEVAKLRAALCQ
jgi:hypothetical protein